MKTAFSSLNLFSHSSLIPSRELTNASVVPLFFGSLIDFYQANRISHGMSSLDHRVFSLGFFRSLVIS